jgi:N4-(beta-N-acetylglucosaminyl)-L-asparaginase
MPEVPNESRRSFLKKASLAGVGASLVAPTSAAATAPSHTPSRTVQGPVVVSSLNGREAAQRAVEIMQEGGTALDGIIAGVNLVEEDPDDITVGYGGIPNEDGVVQLDAAVMDGPTHRAGSVAALEGIKYPSRVARLVMERTDHVLLVGEGAQEFARMHGFPIENLLTERARELWVEWKETLSTDDDYLPPHDIDDENIGGMLREIERHYGTIHCSALDLNGNLGSVTTTSGLFYKIPGRVGDSPIIGAGLYCDNEVGAAGSTGRGEANLQNLTSYLIVERMRMGDTPEEACLYACRRIDEKTKMARLRNEQGAPNFNVRFYAINKAGEVGGAQLRGADDQMIAADADGVREVNLAYVYE